MTTGSLNDFVRSSQLMVPRGSRLPGSARVLLGWLPREHGESLLARQAEDGLPETQRARVSRARDTVAARAAGIDQAGLISPLPDELAGHVTRLGSTPGGARMRAEGWEIAMVDLDRVVALQPSVFTGTAIERAAHLDPGDLRAVAELTLPVSHPRPIGELPPGDDVPPIEGQYHYLTQTYTFVSPNLNLTVAGNFDAPGNRDAPQPGGLLGHGFNITVPPSFLQVARFQGRYLLRDGHHRAFGLLSRGITRVPAYVRDVAAAEELVTAGIETLPRSAWVGDRPPLLRDYHDDLVAEPVLVPVPHRMIVIHAVELLIVN
jgi:ParB-like chromosome segregation protein Spo0J